MIEEAEDGRQSQDKPILIEELVVRAGKTANVPAEETLDAIKSISTACAEKAAKLFTSAVVADEKRGGGTFDTLRQTDELLAAVVSRRDRDTLAFGVAALEEMSREGPQVFGSRVAVFHEKFMLLKTASNLGTLDRVLPQVRGQIRRQGNRPPIV